MMPVQLQNDNLRFVKIRKSDKRPFEPNWHKSGYKWNDESMIQHIHQGGNYGVIGGFNNLIIIDFDSIEAYDKLRPFLPVTFSTLTANKKLPHLYYYVKEFSGIQPKSMKFCDDKKNTLMDIQGEGKQCVGPGSKIGDNEYKVWLDVPIVTVNYYHLKNLIEHFYKPLEVIIPVKKPMPKITNSVSFVFDRVTIPQILNKLGVKITTHRKACCPMHASVGEMCLDYTDSKWYCFHCGAGGYAQNLIMQAKNCSWKEAKKWLEKEFNVSD